VDVRRVVDLTQPVATGSPVYPGDPEVRVDAAATIGADGVNISRLALGSHSGTHVDAPFHVRGDGASLDDLDPGLFTGTGVIADVTGRAARQPIGWADLAPIAAGLGRGRVLLIRTGWDRHWGTPAYADHPHLDPDAVRRVLDLGVRTIGIDAESVDPASPDDAHGLPVHHVVAAAGGVIAENLADLGGIDFPDPLITLLPLRIAGGDGSPVRAAALEIAP
jgi:kynurenine formamidase